MALLTICLAIAAYWPALTGTLLWDDSSHVTRPELQSFHGLWRIWFDLGATQQYYPLLHSAFWLEHHIWGDAVIGYHLTNVLLHGISAILIALILRRLAIPGAWLAGMIFAIHPVTVEAVAWISEQKSTLSAVFYLSSALLYLDFDRTRRRKTYWLAFGLFLLALMSKSITATLPAALLVVLWWKRGKLNIKQDVKPLIPWLAVGAGAGLFTAWVERTYIGATGSEYALSIVDRFLLAGRVLWFYPSKIFWPVNLIFIYPRWTIDAGVWWQWLFPLAVFAVAATFGRITPKNRAPLAAFLFLAGTLFPVLGFLNVYPFRYAWVADHFQYLASLGIIVPLSAGLVRISEHARIQRSLAQGAGALLVAVLGCLTWLQSGTYRNSTTLYTVTLERNPGAWMAHNNLGQELARNPGRMPDAISHYEAALKIKPDAPEPNNNLGNALLNTPGQEKEAMALFRTALQAKPNYADAHTNLGNALLATGQIQAAIEEHQNAIAIKPDLAEAHYNLANALRLVPARLSEAVGQYQEALRLDPGMVDAHLNLGSTLSQIPGRSAEAIEEVTEALRLRPDYPEGHYNLGMVLASEDGQLANAVSEFETALRLRPDYIEAHANLGIALLDMPNRKDEAIAHLETAVRLGPQIPEAHYMLGAGLSEIPARVPQAIAEFRTALRLRPKYAEAHYGLANALAHSGSVREAIAECEAALAIQPDLTPARELLNRLRR
jgi:tetratricopeptide (TPR) repeat protein